jgi:nucleoside-diphosphate-sugar epimerase
MKYLIIGGAGYLGTHLTDICLQNNDEVIVYDSLFHGALGIDKFKSIPNFRFVRGEVENIDSKLFNGVDVVLYLASPRLETNNALLNTNTYLSTLSKVYDMSVDNKVKKFLFPSTCSVYGYNEKIVDEDSPINITSTYSELKYKSELVLRNQESRDKNKIQIYLPRISTLYGESSLFREDLIINNMIKTALDENIIRVYGKDMWRPNLYVRDAAKLLLSILDKELAGIINVGSNDLNITKKDIVDTIIDSIGGSILISYSSNKDDRSYRVNFDKLQNGVDYYYTTYRSGIDNTILFLK